ncbi:hypothetical protein P1X14_16605 [Sphingomonas sp. AOB5]|uniref:hypothetical protein n=1 Tax=Sphingomonas sp. AOB5 TaxID=3034017 RepID=UPI0023F70E1C|nr:hypothetical protein [Sphingomonas sp. AOB5]MDF7776880.1 hypothetical protein [Sphingomonas sp. AOB5]
MGRTRPRSTAPSGASAEEQLAIAKILLRRLWRTLEHRFPGAAAEYWDSFDCDAHALVDRAFEAAARLWERDRIYVEPCRRILDEHRAGRFRYLATWGNGETRVLTEIELVQLAGLPIEDDERTTPDDEIPF